MRQKISGIRQILHFDNRWQLILQRIFFGKTHLHVYRLGVLEFLVDHAGGDAVGVRDAIVSGMYRNLIQKISLSKSLSMIDLGANGGGVPLLLGSMGFQITRMVCVEMNPNTFARLEFNLRRNFDCPVQPIQAALCGEKKEFRIRLGDGSTSDSLYQCSNLHDGKAKEYLVHGITFDDAFRSLFDPEEDWVDLVKIDIEGAEYEVFQNNGHECIRRCRHLIMEIHRVQDETWREELLAKLGELGFDRIAFNAKTSVYLFSNRHAH